MRQESLRTLIAISTQGGLELHHIDVATAFLSGTLEEEVYTERVREKRQRALGVQTKEKYLWAETVPQVLEHST